MMKLSCHRQLPGIGLAAATAALVLAMPAPGQPVEIFEIEGGPARAQQAIHDVRNLSQTRFPSADELGPGWRRPWEGPRGVPGGFRSEGHYWASVQTDPLWAQLFGLTAQEAESALHGAVVKIDGNYQAALAVNPKPPEWEDLKDFLTPEGLLRVAILKTRLFTSIAYESHAAFVARNSDLSTSMIQRIAAAARIAREDGLDENEDRTWLTNTVLHEWFDATCPELKEAARAELVTALAHEVAGLRQYSKMVYIHGSDETLRSTSENPEGPPIYGRMTVQLSVLSRDAVRTRVKDQTPTTLPSVEASISDMFTNLYETIRSLQAVSIDERLAELDQEIAILTSRGHEAAWQKEERDTLQQALDAMPAGRRINASAQLRDFGDNTWVLVIDGFPASPIHDYNGYYAHMRNGNAVVDIHGVGTYPRSWFLEQIDYVLAAMDERTAVFRQE